MSVTRREFLKSVSATTVASGAIGSGIVNAAVPASSSAALEFGFDDNKVPMNAANLCPMPTSVGAAVTEYQNSLDRDMSGPNRQRLADIKEKARGRIAALLGVSGDDLALVRNTSEANNVVVQGLPLKAGDEVLVWDQNHPSNSVAWQVQGQRQEYSVRKFSVSPDSGSIDEVVEQVLQAIGPKTAVLSFTHISNITGFRLPLQEICQAVKQKGDVYVHVDGAQSWGAVDLDLSRIGCDSFSASAHKWFMGPRETGLLYVARSQIGTLWPNIVSIPWGNDVVTSQVGARKFEALGQRDDAELAALDAAADFHERLTPQGIEQRSAAVAAYLRENLIDLGVPMVSPTNPDFASSVVILRGERASLMELVEKILQDAGIILAPVNGLRMSPHVYNDRSHVDRVVASIRKYRHLLPDA